MKLVILVDGSTSNFEKMIDLVGNKKSLFIDTEHCDENHEYKYLKQNILDFSQSDKEIMLSKISGRESIIQELGDEYSGMILSLSYNKNSKYYIENPIDTFLDLIQIFRQETN